MTDEVILRPVKEDDLLVFFEQQLDPEATRMAIFPPRNRDDFMTHWGKIMVPKALKTNVKTIAFRGEVAGYIVAWEVSEKIRIGYWLGKEYWGRGIATCGLSKFVAELKARPLYAHVAKENIASIRVLHKCGFTVCGEESFAGVDGKEGEEFIMKLGSG